MRSILLILALSLQAFAGNDSKDLKSVITSTNWRYDQPNVKGRSLKFRNDGTCQATTWQGVWKVTGSETVEITLRDSRKAVLTFNADRSGYTGTGFDGMEMIGKRVGDVPASVR